MDPVTIFHIVFPVVTAAGGFGLAHYGVSNTVKAIQSDISAIKTALSNVKAAV